MLYDPKWEDLVYQGVSRREFIAWLETMPPNEQYEFLFAGICAIAQFLKSKGASPEDQIVRFGSVGTTCPNEGRWLLHIVGTRPYTYCAALERARAITTR